MKENTSCYFADKCNDFIIATERNYVRTLQRMTSHPSVNLRQQLLHIDVEQLLIEEIKRLSPAGKNQNNT